MKLPKPSQDFEQCPAGNHLAICCRVIDLGTQETTYMGQPKRQRKVYIEWQTPHERTIDDAPHIAGKRYTLSSSERSNLRQDLESWRGRRFKDSDFEGDNAFDLSSILGAHCLITVITSERDGKRYADVKTVAAIPKGTERPPIEGPTTYLSLEPDSFEPEVFAGLSDRLRQTIAESPEYRALIGTLQNDAQSDHQQHHDTDDGIPF